MNKVTEKLCGAFGIYTTNVALALFSHYLFVTRRTALRINKRAVAPFFVYAKHLGDNISRFSDCNYVADINSLFVYKILIMERYS